MKILMLTPYLPYPLTSGGQIRSYNLLKKLVGRHEITLFSFIRQESERRYIKDLKPFCSDIKVFKRRPAWSPVNILLAGLTLRPFLLSIYYSPAFKTAIKEELESGDYDLIHSECFYLMHNLPKTEVPILMIEQTIEYLVYKNVVKNLLWYFTPFKPLLYLDVFKIKFWEKYFWKRADRLVTMSEDDRQFIADLLPEKKIDVVANGVDLEFFEAVEREPSEKPTVLFVGQFRWHPNVEAALELAEKIWPRIKEAVPDARLWVVGRNPTARIASLAANPDVRVTEVEDIREVLHKAWVLLAPIRNGRGTKYKVLEAMASELPVVTTPLGIEGIATSNSEEVLVAESVEDLADAAISILVDEERGLALAKQAKKIVSTHYSWEPISDELDSVYRKVGGG